MGCRVGKSVGTWAENADQRPNIGPLTWCFLERMTRFELATLTLAKKRLWSPSVQSVYCAAVLHSPENRPGNPSSPSSSYTALPSGTRAMCSACPPGSRHSGVDCMLLDQIRSTWVGDPRRDRVHRWQTKPARSISAQLASGIARRSTSATTAVRTLEPMLSWNRSW